MIGLQRNSDRVKIYHRAANCGAGGGTRTHTAIRPPDFKSQQASVQIKDCLIEYRAEHLSGIRSGEERYGQLQRLLSDFRTFDQLNSPKLNQRLGGWTGATRNRYRAALNHFLRWSRGMGYTDLRPDLFGGRETPRDAVLSLKQCQALYETVPELSPRWRPFCALLMLTGQRRGEVARFDSTLPVWTITGTKNGTDHLVHLSGKAQWWARQWQKPPVDYRALKLRWFGHAGIPTKYRFHDIRRSFATHLVEDGQDPQVIDRILNHCGGAKGVSRVYNRAQMLPQRRDAMLRWEEMLTGNHYALAQTNAKPG